MKPHVMGMKMCLDLQKLPLEIEAETAEMSMLTVIRTRNVTLMQNLFELKVYMMN